MPSFRIGAKVQPEGPDLEEDDLLILFMGPTGSGKSHIIDILTQQNQNGKRASSRLRSSTSAVSVTRVYQGGRRLVLIDTPGFDDTHKSDMEILEIISQPLVQAYNTKCQIVGIIYLLRITDNRISETIHRNFHVFSQLCGYEAAKNVVLVTTMWDQIEGESDVGEKLEEEFKEKMWAAMLGHGASTTRFDNTPESARKIISKVVSQAVCNESESDKGVILRLQQKIVKEKKRIKQTQAGHALYVPLSGILAGTMNKAQNDPPNPSDLQQLQEQIDEILKKLRPSAVQRILTWGKGVVLGIPRRYLLTISGHSLIMGLTFWDIEFRENDKGNVGKQNGLLFANDSKKDSKKHRSVIDRERTNLPFEDIQGVVCVNEINGRSSAEQQSDAFRKESFVGQQIERNYSTQNGELESRSNIGHTKLDDIMTLSGDDIIVAIMGLTGAGKSNFIDHLTGMTGKPGKRAGDTMRSCTSDVGAIRIENHPKYKNRLVVVDTPGFDDTDRSDDETLAIIDQWLIELYKSNIFLHGVIYTHRITDTRLSGAHCRSLGMFAELCREKVVNNVLFVMTMWDEVLRAKTELEEEREQHLKKEWSSVFERDACTARFYNTSESAWDILETMVENMAFSRSTS